jgi:hypothetical protein
MKRLMASLSNGATGCALALRLTLVLVFLAAATLSRGQERQQWTERKNLGFKGQVRSALTTVARPNPDPRPNTTRRLFVEGAPDWAVFDTQGRRVEFASASSPDGIEVICKCAYEADGTKVCKDSTGQRQESREQQTILPDGSREVTHFQGSKVAYREVTQLDEKGASIAFKVYHSDGELSSETLILPNGDEEWKIYDDNGHVISDMQTRESQDKTRFDRWSYDQEGRLVWHLALNGDGELLSYWYDIGSKPNQSASDSLGVCRPRLCVSYKFDDEGSGHMDKIVQRTPGEGNLEPDSEEHYNFDGVLDERVEIRYVRDDQGNWTARSVLAWDATSDQMIEIERDTRTIEYY